MFQRSSKWTARASHRKAKGKSDCSLCYHRFMPHLNHLCTRPDKQRHNTPTFPILAFKLAFLSLHAFFIKSSILFQSLTLRPALCDNDQLFTLRPYRCSLHATFQYPFVTEPEPLQSRSAPLTHADCNPWHVYTDQRYQWVHQWPVLWHTVRAASLLRIMNNLFCSVPRHLYIFNKRSNQICLLSACS